VRVRYQRGPIAWAVSNNVWLNVLKDSSLADTRGAVGRGGEAGGSLWSPPNRQGAGRGRLLSQEEARGETRCALQEDPFSSWVFVFRKRRLIA